MSLNTCALSGNILETPVVSTKTGHVFEKRVIEKHIEATGQCPITGQELELSDIVAIQHNKNIKPKPLKSTSVPGMLTVFQNEWDTLMLETYELKQHLHTVRQELSHALYQHDAACRVIARLIRERDEARRALGELQHRVTNKNLEDKENMEAESLGLTQDIIDTITSTSKKLTKARKKRVISENLASAEKLTEYKNTKSYPIHSSTDPGIVAIDVHPVNSNLLLTGGKDGNGVIFDKESEKKLVTFDQHSKRITDVAFMPSTSDSNIRAVTCSADNNAFLWTFDTANGNKELSYAMTHDSEVVGCSLHPINQYMATGCRNGSWKFHDINRGVCLSTIASEGSQFYSSKFHPDGVIFATGCADGTVQIWDVSTQQVATKFQQSLTNPITSLAFSENGFYLGIASNKEPVVQIWDLRKLAPIETIDYAPGRLVNSVVFDHSGKYLAVGGNSINVYEAKSWKPVCEYSDHKAPVTGLAFGPDASWLASVSLDRALKIYQ